MSAGHKNSPLLQPSAIVTPRPTLLSPAEADGPVETDRPGGYQDNPEEKEFLLGFGHAGMLAQARRFPQRASLRRKKALLRGGNALPGPAPPRRGLPQTPEERRSPRHVLPRSLPLQRLSSDGSVKTHFRQPFSCLIGLRFLLTPVP